MSALARSAFRAVARLANPSASSVGPATAVRGLASGQEVSKSASHDSHGHGTPLGAQPRDAALAYHPEGGNEPVGHTRDGGDIDWKGVNMPLNSSHLFGPGSAPGQTPTDFEQSTGRERYELMYRMAGLDPWHIGELDVPFAGTPEHPVFVWSSNPFRIVGCTGYPKDSHDRKYMRVRMGPIATRCGDCGTAYALDYVGPFRNEHGRLLGLAPESTPDKPVFFEDPELHAHDQFKGDVELDFHAVREGRPGTANLKRWKGWERAETPSDWVTQGGGDSSKAVAIPGTEDRGAKPWWEYARNLPFKQDAGPGKASNVFGSFLQAHDHGHH